RSDVQTSIVSRDLLYRYGVRVPVRVGGPSVTAIKSEKASARKRYDPPAASKGNQASSASKTKAGIKLLLKKRYSSGVRTLHAAIKLNPRNEKAIYNYACGLSLSKKRKDALQWLQNLADLGSEASSEHLIKARSDGDFTAIRSQSEFKRITGYARIYVINHIGMAGEKAVENIETVLKKLGHTDIKLGNNDKPRNEPELLFRQPSAAQVSLLAELLNHPRTRLGKIKDDAPYDIIIHWGAKVKKKDGQVSVESFGPSTVDKKLDAARSKQNRILAKPERAINKVDRVVSSPERAYKKVENMGKRADRTYKKTKGVFNKVKGFGEKINSL
ncbi:MAG TPA: hypothetical protein DCQ06_07520, partial [Myxococcales bacterium]|nr:hypothetical protein [Myxococcales bacterium]